MYLAIHGNSTDLGLIDMFLINLNAEVVTCVLSFRKSHHQPNLESTSKYGFFPDCGGKWCRSEHAHSSYPELFFRPPGLSPYMGREERRVQGLDYKVHGNFHVPYHMFSCKVHGNFHVPSLMLS